MYIYCMFCYHVIATPYVRSVVSLHTVTLLMMTQNAQWTMSYLYSLKVFLSNKLEFTIHLMIISSSFVNSQSRIVHI